MAWNGSGVYSAPSSPGAFNPATTGGTADPTDWNNLLQDLTGATGLSNAICRDGQSTITANIPFNDMRITGLGAAIAAADAAQTAQVQNSAFTYAVDTGTSTAYAIALSPAVTTYVVGQQFEFLASHSNTTTTPTLAVNSLTAGSIVFSDGSAVAIGDIAANGIVRLSVSAVTGSTPTFQMDVGKYRTPVAPTTQSFTTGSAATYTTPAGVAWIKVRMVGAGGGGGGAGAGTSAGGNGTDTIFNSIHAAAGTGGPGPASTVGGTGGSAGSGSATLRVPGGQGDAVNQVSGTGYGGHGGNAPFFNGGGAVNGTASAAGNAGVANTGGGGAGATGDHSSFNGANGGGSGEYVELIISSPVATYTYTVGTAGTAGTGTVAGGAGAAGFITVEEHYGA